MFPTELAQRERGRRRLTCQRSEPTFFKDDSEKKKFATKPIGLATIVAEAGDLWQWRPRARSLCSPRGSHPGLSQFQASSVCHADERARRPLGATQDLGDIEKRAQSSRLWLYALFTHRPRYVFKREMHVDKSHEHSPERLNPPRQDCVATRSLDNHDREPENDSRFIRRNPIHRKRKVGREGNNDLTTHGPRSQVPTPSYRL